MTVNQVWSSRTFFSNYKVLSEEQNVEHPQQKDIMDGQGIPETEHKPKLRNWKGNNKDFSDYHDRKRLLLVRYDLWTPRPLNLPKGNVEAKSRNTWVDIHKSRQDVSNCDEGATWCVLSYLPFWKYSWILILFTYLRDTAVSNKLI